MDIICCTWNNGALSSVIENGVLKKVFVVADVAAMDRATEAMGYTAASK
jgi:hypothetical protein